jgi:hypothetical protein
MHDVNEILASYNLNALDIQRITTEAKAASVGCGERCVSRGLLQPTWDLLDDISDEIWYSKMKVSHKISLGFQFFEIFPSYYHFLVPFYRGIRNKEISLLKHKEIIWSRFIQYLLAEAYYADPVSYVLWVEFFEDITTVRDTWQGLLSKCHSKKPLLAMLEIAGPVPFDLKEECYKSLIIDKSTHKVIFNSLLHSAFDFYGNIDNKKASIILDGLSVDTNTENYKLLKGKLRENF